MEQGLSRFEIEKDVRKFAYSRKKKTSASIEKEDVRKNLKVRTTKKEDVT